MRSRLAFAIIVYSLIVGAAWGRDLTIGVEEINYAPYYHSERDEYQGFAREYFDAFAAEYGYRFRYRTLPIARLYRELVAGKVDFKFPDHPYWGKEYKAGVEISYSKPIVGFVDGVMVLSERKDITWKEFTKVGYVRGFTPWMLMPYIESGKVKSTEVNSWKSVFKLALNRRVDGAYYNVQVAEAIMKQEFGGEQSLEFAPKLPHDKANYHLSSVNQKKVLQKLDEFAKSPQANALRKKYGLSVYELE